MTYLDSYCERAGQADLWAEPVNALTNVAFFIATYYACKALRRTGIRAYDLWILCGLLGCIGLGSALWHIFANEFTILMDVIPITLFINLYVVVLLARAMVWPWWGCALGFILLQAMNAAASVWFNPDTLYGTIMYVPTYGMLLGLCAVSAALKKPFAKELLIITGLWTCSLIFRTIDIPLCHATHIGTHFLWHSANAVVLYALIMVLVGEYKYQRSFKHLQS
jgi:hypothetical protein